MSTDNNFIIKYSSQILSIPGSKIIFECNDFSRDTGLILLKQKKDPNKYEIHLHDDYTHNAIAMVLDIKDLQKMFESLEEYFQIEQIAGI